LAQAKAQAEQFLAEAKAEADRHANAAQQRVEAANKQYETVQAHLAQISQLLGPGAAGLASAAAAAPALQAGPAPARAVAAAPANGGGGVPSSRSATASKTEQKQPNGKPADGEEEWWTE
jgi:hypothetical protein